MLRLVEHLKFEEDGYNVLVEVLFDEVAQEYIMFPFRRSVIDHKMRFFMARGKDKMETLQNLRERMMVAAREAKNAASTK